MQHLVHADTGERSTEVHRHDAQSRGLLGEHTAQAVTGDRLPVEVAAQERIVVAGEDLDRGVDDGRVGEMVGHDPGAGRADVGRGAHHDDLRGEARRHGGEHAFDVGPDPVDLVDEHDGGHAEAAQRTEQQQRLGLHALDRGDDEHGAVEHAEHPLDLGDEVRVARRVDQVDGHAVDDERRHRRLDRDPALALQRERVGLRRAVVDATDLVDDPGCVQQPFGEGGLTGVDVRQDPQVERCHFASRPSDRLENPDR